MMLFIYLLLSYSIYLFIQVRTECLYNYLIHVWLENVLNQLNQ